jgi:hypothetical protein
LHNFIEELNHRVNPDLYIEELFGRKSLFKYIYLKLNNLFNEIFIQQNLLFDTMPVENKKSQSKSKTKKQKIKNDL